MESMNYFLAPVNHASKPMIPYLTAGVVETVGLTAHIKPAKKVIFLNLNSQVSALRYLKMIYVCCFRILCTEKLQSDIYLISEFGLQISWVVAKLI